ncbi:MAG: hypothetical protein RLZZ436_424 [Planctomycetota bacterium]|jgi:arylsulfatase A-like enzyme
MRLCVRQRLLLTLLLPVLTGFPAAPGSPAVLADDRSGATRPNIVFILADDLGWRDLGCFGSRFHRTPNLDRLASQGLRLTQAYSASPLCSPTRASILTGLYPARIGITAPACHLPAVQLEKRLTPNPGPGVEVINADSLTRLQPDYVTLAELLRQSGYRTAHFGKWHLGHSGPWEPAGQGFELDFPHTPAAPGPGGGYFAPWSFIKSPPLEAVPGEHIDHRMATRAAEFIREHAEEPFFLNFWTYSVHSPWNSRPELIEEFRDTVDPQNPQRNPLYAAMVRSLDQSVGMLLQAIQDAGVAERTLIVFFADNGGWAYPPKSTDPAGFEQLPATSNAPLRSGKASLYEGGTRVPCIVSWPGRIAAGSTSDALLQSTDFLPTFRTLLQLPAGQPEVCDGIDQSELFLNSVPCRDFAFCHFPHGGSGQAQGIPGFLPGSWLREKQWKLIRFYGRGADGSDLLELYDLENDLSETTNLAEKQPEITARLLERMNGILRDTEAVIPVRNPGYDPQAADKQSRKKPGKSASKQTTETEDPALQGWKPRACTASVKGGTLIVRRQGPQPFLGFATGQSPGAWKLSFRIRLPLGGSAMVQCRQSPTDTATAADIPWTAPAAPDWQQVQVQIPADAPRGILRVYLPADAEMVEIDSIQLQQAAGTRVFDF